MHSAFAASATPMVKQWFKTYGSALIAVIAAGMVVVAAPLAYADRFDDQIRSLNQQNNITRGQQQGLVTEEASLAAVVADLQAKAVALEQQIAENNAKHATLEQKIAQTKADIDQQKTTLGQSIKAMYLDGRISTLEMLASSKNLSAFVDRQQHRQAVSNKVQEALVRIEALKKQLEAQKTTVEKILVDQQALRVQLDANRAEAGRLLGMNQTQQTTYEQDIRGNNRKIADLRRQQAIENARYFKNGWVTGGSGGYPWAAVPYPSSTIDPWGMYMRECVSYTAWKVASTGRYMPYWGGRGNANQWDDNARAAGIPVDTVPRVGDVAVSNAGTFGHVMYVEAVNGDGTITVSQYNAGWDGKYSTGKRSAAGLYYVHF